MTEKKSVRTVSVDIDLTARMLGFGSADRPTEAHRRIMKYYSSPFLLGPKPSDLLLELITHMFTEEEAEIVQHLPPWRPRTEAKVAELAHRPVDETKEILDRLAFTKSVVLAYGDPRKYTILPIVPGTFEMSLMTPDLSTRNEWHRKFAHLFEKLFETGFMADYPGSEKSPPLRYLPVGRVTPTLYTAWPSDHLEEILEPFNDFAVGHCQCRLAMKYVGKDCGKPTDNCLTFGGAARNFAKRGFMRKIDRVEAIALKREAEEAGCVSWMMNGINPRTGGGSCSCCGCCCHALRALKLWNMPGFVSRPHFMPQLIDENCTKCRKCVKACPMDAWSVIGDTLVFNSSRCIGCGLCTVACKKNALTLVALRDAVPPPSPARIDPMLTQLPAFLTNGFRLWAKRIYDDIF